MEVETTVIGDVVVFKLNGELTSRGDLASIFWVHLHKGNFKFILNLEKLRLLNSVGISTLLEFKRLAESSGGTLILLSPCPEVFSMLQTIRLDEVFVIADDEDVALSSLLAGLPVIGNGSTVSRYRN